MKRVALSPTKPSNQRGVVLVVALLFMLLIIIVGLAGSSQSNTQMHISSNSMSHQVAFQSADATLRSAFLSMRSGNFDSVDFSLNTAGYFTFDVTLAPVWLTNIDDNSYWQSASNAVQSYQGGSSQANSYVVEKMPAIATPGKTLGNANQFGKQDSGSNYRVTARGIGPQGSSPVVLQAIFAK